MVGECIGELVANDLDAQAEGLAARLVFGEGSRYTMAIRWRGRQGAATQAEQRSARTTLIKRSAGLIERG